MSTYVIIEGTPILIFYPVAGPNEVHTNLYAGLKNEITNEYDVSNDVSLYYQSGNTRFKCYLKNNEIVYICTANEPTNTVTTIMYQLIYNNIKTTSFILFSFDKYVRKFIYLKYFNVSVTPQTFVYLSTSSTSLPDYNTIIKIGQLVMLNINKVYFYYNGRCDYDIEVEKDPSMPSTVSTTFLNTYTKHSGSDLTSGYNLYCLSLFWDSNSNTVKTINMLYYNTTFYLIAYNKGLITSVQYINNYSTYYRIIQ